VSGDERSRAPLETSPEPEPRSSEPDDARAYDERASAWSWSEATETGTVESEQQPPVPPPAPPFSWPVHDSTEHKHEFHHPLDRVTGRLPRRLRIAVDWIVTIIGAIAIVLAIKAYVVNPYRIPSSSMEATLHCARPAPGCESRFSDRVLANRFIYRFRDPQRGEVVVFNTPPKARAECGAGGTFVKRIIGLPGETVQIRLRRGAAFVYIDGRRLEEPYIEHDRRDIGPAERFRVPAGHYFVMGDNRSQSCDSRVWGSVPSDNLIGPVFMTYWPPNRISFR
jgi:signal peptidase I